MVNAQFLDANSTWIALAKVAGLNPRNSGPELGMSNPVAQRCQALLRRRPVVRDGIDSNFHNGIKKNTLCRGPKIFGLRVCHERHIGSFQNAGLDAFVVHAGQILLPRRGMPFRIIAGQPYGLQHCCNEGIADSEKCRKPSGELFHLQGILLWSAFANRSSLSAVLGGVDFAMAVA